MQMQRCRNANSEIIKEVKYSFLTLTSLFYSTNSGRQNRLRSGLFIE